MPDDNKKESHNSLSSQTILGKVSCQKHFWNTNTGPKKLLGDPDSLTDSSKSETLLPGKKIKPCKAIKMFESVPLL